MKNRDANQIPAVDSVRAIDTEADVPPQDSRTMENDGARWTKRVSGSEDMQAADFDWSKRQAADPSDRYLPHREGHPDGFIMVDRSASPEFAESNVRNAKREESDIL